MLFPYQQVVWLLKNNIKLLFSMEGDEEVRLMKKVQAMRYFNINLLKFYTFRTKYINAPRENYVDVLTIIVFLYLIFY